jgi:hypothetical protein
MQLSNFCFAADCAKQALNDAVCAIVSASALAQWANLVQSIKDLTCFDINRLFETIALLAVLCWISAWIAEAVIFMTKTIPRFIKNLLCGKVSLCLLDCDDHDHDHDHHHHHDHDDDEHKNSDFHY